MLNWVIQQSSKDSILVAEACDRLQIPYQWLDYRPFSTDLPDLEEEKCWMFTGSTGLTDTVYQSGKYKPGVIPVDTNWINHPNVLNAGQFPVSLRNALTWAKEPQVFIRPLKDDKLFSGQVMSRVELENWLDDLQEKDMKEVLATPVLISSVKQLPHEWRCFMANGKFVTGSHYRSYGQLMSALDVPRDVVQFVEKNLFPFPVYVIDVCMTMENELKIVELNGFNSCGFYSSDVEKLVKAVSDLYA